MRGGGYRLLIQFGILAAIESVLGRRQFGVSIPAKGQCRREGQPMSGREERFLITNPVPSMEHALDE
jgi:hypothetical protein